MKVNRLYQLLILPLVFGITRTFGQTVTRYTVHKMENRIGQEEVSTSPADKDSVIHISIKTSDRGTAMKLQASFSLIKAAVKYSSVGNTSRFKTENIDTAFALNNNFLVSNNGSIKMKELLVASWTKAGRPAYLLSASDKKQVKIAVIGHEKDPINSAELTVINIGDSPNEILWVDAKGKALYLATCDSEGDKREVIDDSYLPQFNFFNTRSNAYLIDTYRKNNVNLGQSFTNVAVVGCNIVDVAYPGKVSYNRMLLLQNGKITYVGAVDKALILPGTHVIDATGKFVIPGLWNMHVHLFHPDYLRNELLSGVTTVRDMGNEFDFICAIKKAANDGNIPAPHVLTAGLLDGKSPNSLGIIRASNDQEIKQNVKKYHDAGFDQIKVYSYVKKEDFNTIVKEARLYNMPVVGHLPNGYTVGYFIENGMNSISHIHYFMNSLKWTGADLKTSNKELLDKLIENKVYLDPTINIYTLTGDARIASYKKLVKLFFDYGVPIVAGTDNEGTIAGEIQNYVKLGMSPLDAIRSATIVPAAIMKMSDQSGSIEKGKNADLLLLDADPLQHIETLDHVNTVIKGQLVIKK
jgi:imidazolonepropionase-like amidohydrolase